jgi:hypothetical protein
MPTAPRKRHYRTPSRLARYVATDLGLKPASVEQLIHGHAPIQERFAALVRAARLLGDHAMEARLMGPVRAVNADLPALELNATLIRTATAADLREDQSRTAFLCARMQDPRAARNEARQWLADMDVAMGRMVEMRAAVVGYIESVP